MGRVAFEPVVHHPSHPHPLELSSLQDSLVPPQCAGCTTRATGNAYSCKLCNYFLHPSCSQMVPQIQHPSHPNHPLSLLFVPAYEEGSFHCDACGRQGSGFSYNCKLCDVDLHGACACMPFHVQHQSHAHPLSLAFFSPYGGKSFSCDVCGQLGPANQWLYRCSCGCDFDAHLGCATAPGVSKPVQAQQQQRQQQYVAAGVPLRPQQPSSLGFFVSRPTQPQIMRPQLIPTMRPQLVQPQMAMRPQLVQPQMAMRPQPMQPQMMMQPQPSFTQQLIQDAATNLVQGAAQQLGQNLVQGVFGGGGGGGGDAGQDGGGTTIVYEYNTTEVNVDYSTGNQSTTEVTVDYSGGGDYGCE